MYIITNCTDQGSYTPSKANTYEEAYAWMIECTAANFRSAYGYGLEDDGKNPDKMSDTEIIEWAKENMCDYAFEFGNHHSKILYADSSFNEMRIYNLDEI